MRDEFEQIRQEGAGPNRTPTEKVEAAVGANRKKEPVLLLDLSGSMDWDTVDERNGPEFPSAQSRRAVVIGALGGLVSHLESEDSEAEAEQADGSDEHGGLMAHGFSNGHVEIGDLNSSNLERKLRDIPWGGTTHIMPAWKAALADYDEEFGDKDPVDQPTMLVLVITDGEADDWQDFAPVLESANAKRVFAVAIVGHGPRQDATFNAYTSAAKRQQAKDKFQKAHVSVTYFDGVSDPGAITTDLITLMS